MDSTKEKETCFEILKNVLSGKYEANTFKLGGYQEMSVCIEEDKGEWLVYTGERGNKYGEERADSCFAACLLFLQRIEPKKEKLSSLKNEFIINFLVSETAREYIE